MTTQNSLEESYLVLVRFLMLSKRRVFELGDEYGLTGMQAMMLFLLDKPRPMHSFKQVFNCDASNITGLVDGLEQKKLASRYESKEDRRIKMVKLDAKGKRVRAALVRQSTAANSPLLSKLNPGELKAFIQLLRKITSGEQHV
jgi:DNA-binding MarR family transcriptional regulator